MLISTRSFPLSGFTSSTTPLKSWKGPSTTFTCSPCSKSTLGFGLTAPLGHLVRDLAHLGLGDGRDGARVGRAAEEAGDLGGRLDDVPGLVVELHVDEDVAGEELARRGLLLPLDQLDHLLRRHQYLAVQVRLA